jgi:hypothetical protein
MIEAAELNNKVTDQVAQTVGSIKRTKSKDDEKLKIFLDTYYDLKRFIYHFVQPGTLKKIKKVSKDNEYDLTRMKRLHNSSLEDEMPETRVINFKGYINSENVLLIDKYEEMIEIMKFMKKWLSKFEEVVGTLREQIELRENLYQQDMKLIMESWRKYNKKTLLESRRKQ